MRGETTNCPACGASFHKQRLAQRYCTAACRKAAYDKRTSPSSDEPVISDFGSYISPTECLNEVVIPKRRPTLAPQARIHAYCSPFAAIGSGPVRMEPDEMKTNLEDRGALSVDEFCGWACIGRSKFYQQVAEGRIRVRKVGRKSVVTVPDARAWLDSLPDGRRANAA